MTLDYFNHGDPIITYHLALALHGDGKSERAADVLEALLDQPGEFSDRAAAQALLDDLRKESS